MTPADTIVHVAKELTQALCGNTPPPLVKSNIDHIWGFTNIFTQTKNKYPAQHNVTSESRFNSPSSATPLRVGPTATDIPELAPIKDCSRDDDNEDIDDYDDNDDNDYIDR